MPAFASYLTSLPSHQDGGFILTVAALGVTLVILSVIVETKRQQS